MRCLASYCLCFSVCRRYALLSIFGLFVEFLAFAWLCLGSWIVSLLPDLRLRLRLVWNSLRLVGSRREA